MASDEKSMLPSHSAEPSSRKVKRRRVIIVGLVMGVIAIALAVGLGVGLTVGRPTHRRPPPAPSSTPTTIGSGGSQGSAAMWKPTAGMSWDYDILGPVKSTDANGVVVHDIDLWDNEASTITTLKSQKVQNQDVKVICYFSAGTSEDWREDDNQFTDSDKGSSLPDWPGERWLKTSSPTVRKVMEARLDQAVQKGCNAVDPDNVDGFDNDNGLGLSKEDAVDYVTFLANAAHSRNLAVGLKNAGSIIPEVLNLVDFSVNEECLQYEECERFAPFIQQNKPVFHVEYPKGDDVSNTVNVASSELNGICDDSSAKGFSTIVKNINLDTFLQECPAS
jgi:hypothetical protein